MEFVLSSRENVWGGGEVFLYDVSVELVGKGHALLWRIPKTSSLARKASNGRLISRSFPAPRGVVIANDFRSLWTSIVLDGIRVRIFVIHGTWQLSLIRALVLRAFRVRVFCVNGALLARANELGVKGALLLPLGPREVSKSSVRDPLVKSRVVDIVFGTIARLDPVKRLELFCSTVEALGATGILVVPPAKTELERSVRDELRSFRSIQVFDDGDAEHVWTTADVFLSTSVDESLGLAHIEALQRGIPVLTTARQGPTEFLTGPLASGLLPNDLIHNLSTVSEALAKIDHSGAGYYVAAQLTANSRGPRQSVEFLLRNL
ncbi:glycosyltransferase [Cryobacterium sp. 10I5]|uniref:glycosyltransferase n=1 Tax=Cryobacterium sp. 10I5 TaxID=3048581 RepID=UPI002B23E5C4|nr:glycosyltransferase [Cryobacterium sp. 10I5]MEB0265471.1 glycosyltransferase [Cryobacterium sp. 10I5]